MTSFEKLNDCGFRINEILQDETPCICQGSNGFITNDGL